MRVKRFGIIAFVGAIIFLLCVSSDLSGVVGKAHAQNTPDGLTDIPDALMTYKYAPEKLSEDILKNHLRQIIGKEQAQYKRARKENKTVKQLYKDEFFLFTEVQVAGRAADFAAKDLIEEYKAFLSKEAAAIPDRVRFDHYLRLDYIKYENGVIGAGADVFFKFFIEEEQKKASIPTLGARELFMRTFPLRSEVNSPSFAKLPTSYGRPRLAIDRVPTLPPVAMPRDDAEKLFIRPPGPEQECGKGPPAYPKPNPQVVAAYRSCIKDNHERNQRYNKGFRISFVVTTEGFVEGTNILALRLNKAEIYSPYGDLMKTFLPSDLPAANDAFAVQKTAERKAAQEEATRKQEEAKAKASMRTKIGAADIDGLVLSMSYSDAESAVRRKLEIGRVRELKSTQRTKPFFSDMTQFEKVDGSERIMLFRAKPNSEKLVGIGRMLDLPKGSTLKDVKDQLIAKYGEPTGTIRSHGLTWHGNKETKACALSISWVNAPAIKEGKALPGYEKYGSFTVSPTYVRPKKSEDDVLRLLRDECSPQLFALVQMSKLLVVLLDVPAYAAENIDKDGPTGVKIDL